MWIRLSTIFRATPSPIAKGNTFGHRNANLLPVSCGEAFTTRIVGGKQADMGEHPWLAALEYQTSELFNLIHISQLKFDPIIIRIILYYLIHATWAL